MEVAADVAVSVEAIECAVASTGMRASLLSAPACAVALLFKVEGLDCKNEVATLKRELGPFAGEAWLSFDTSKRLMTVAPQSRTSAGEIAARVASTGVRATLWRDGSAEPLLLSVHGLHCQNEVASLTNAVGPLVGGGRLVFDTAQGTMTVAPHNAVALADIEQAIGRRACGPSPGRTPCPQAKEKAPLAVAAT